MVRKAWSHIRYFDLVAALTAVMILAGHVGSRGFPRTPALHTDVAGWWCPLLGAALLVGFRGRAYAQRTPWIVIGVAALAFTGVAAVFWRLNLLVFIAAVSTGALLLLTGVILRTRRVSEPLSRPDLFALIATAGGLSVGLGLTEGFLRLAPGLFGPEIEQMLRADPRDYGVAHPYIGHLQKPNNTFVLTGRDFHASHRTDAMGFRNAWPWPDQAEIVVVGDSVTFGACVEDYQAWPWLLAQSTFPNRVVNLGLFGSGPQQYLRVFETFGLTLRPTLLLVGVFLENDFWDADTFDRWLQSGAGGNYIAWRDSGQRQPLSFSVRQPGKSVHQLLDATVRPLRSTYWFKLLRAFRGGIEGPPPDPPRILEFPDGRRLQLLEGDYLRKSAAARAGTREFRLTLRALREIHALAAQHGVHALMVLQPGKEQVYLPQLGQSAGDPSRELRPALEKLGIEYLDLSPEFRARAEAGERLFYEVDGHPNAAGQALIAELVEAHIAAHAVRYGLADWRGEARTRPTLREEQTAAANGASFGR